MDPAFWLPATIMILVSAIYFWMHKGNGWVRVFVSAHGITAALIYLAALVLWEFTRGYRPWAVWPFLFVHLIPLISILYAFFRFSGPKVLHFAQLANLSSMMYTIFIAGMAVTGDWL
jgi:hypothetical protein